LKTLHHAVVTHDPITITDAEDGLARGCAQIVVSSHSFQAPGFYRRHGCAEYGRIEGYPRAYAQVHLVKYLRPGRRPPASIQDAGPAANAD
jgi:hypothetical protein